MKPIVACELGRLYSKETVLEILLDRSKFEEVGATFDHIRSLKDIKELKLTENPERKPRGAEKGGDGVFSDPGKADYICPVVGLEMSGKYRFSFIWSCGCTMSERALRQVKSDVCHKCGKAYSDDDIVVLNGTDEEVEGLRGKMEARRAKAKAAKADAKKLKKAGKHKLTESEPKDDVFKKPCIPSSSSSSSSSSTHPSQSSPASSTSNGLSSKLISKDTGSKLKKGSDSKSKTDASRPAVGALVKSKMADIKRGNNGEMEVEDEKVSLIQSNPKNSETFKSLFTTHESEKLQTKPHWITFNPQYF